MCVLHKMFYQVVISALLLFGTGFAGAAQSSIFNVPSTDTQPEKTIYIEGDFFAHFDSYQNGGFQSYGPAIVYGATKNLEVGTNFYYARESGRLTLELQPNIKWKAYKNQKSGLAVSVGAIAFIPLNKATGTRATAMLYANASKSIESLNGLKLTGGIYRVIGAERDFGTKTGATLGVQQPITKKVTFLADWYSGENRFGYTSTGLGYEISKSQYFGIGYSFGNSGRGNNYLTAFYGFTF